MPHQQNQQQQPTTPSQTNAHLTGRVFSRLQQFAAFPQSLQEEVYELEKHISTYQSVVFDKHHVKLVKPVRGVHVSELLERIDAWLLDKKAPAKEKDHSSESDQQQHDHHSASSAPTSDRHQILANDKEPSKHAQRLLEGLIFHGFLTLFKEHEKFPPDAEEMTPSSSKSPTDMLTVKNSDLLIPLSANITKDEHQPITVWQLVKGATYAGIMKHESGVLAPVTKGKEVYVMVNGLLRSVTLFKSDVAREPIAHFEASKNTRISLDKSKHCEHSVKIKDDHNKEMLNTEDESTKNALVQALAHAGMHIKNGNKKEKHATTTSSCSCKGSCSCEKDSNGQCSCQTSGCPTNKNEEREAYTHAYTPAQVP